MEDPITAAFKTGIQEGAKMGLFMAADIVERSCKHWFFCHCKAIAKQLKEGELEVTAVSQRVAQAEDEWDDLINGEQLVGDGRGGDAVVSALSVWCLTRYNVELNFARKKVLNAIRYQNHWFSD